MTAPDDVLESHGASRAWWVVAAVTSIAVGAGALARAGGGGDRGAASPSPPSVATTPVSRAPVPSPAPSLLRGASRAGPWPDDVLVASHGELLRFAATVDGVGYFGGTEPSFLRVPGGTLVHDHYADGEGTGGVLHVPRGGASRELGEADAVAAAARPGFAWLQTGREARRVSVSDARVVQRLTLPPDARLVAEVSGGFVLSYRTRSVLWDGRAERRRFDGDAYAVEAGRVLMLDRGCRPPCARVGDLAAGGAHVVNGFEVDRPPALSPDGRLLAAYVAGLDGAVELLVVDLNLGRRSYVRGSRVALTTRTEVRWSRDGSSVYVLLRARDQAQLALWRAGTDAIALLGPVHGNAMAPE